MKWLVDIRVVLVLVLLGALLAASPELRNDLMGVLGPLLSGSK